MNTRLAVNTGEKGVAVQINKNKTSLEHPKKGNCSDFRDAFVP